MTINSRQKGKRGELMIAKILREHGYNEARRSAQYCGKTGDAADVVGIPGYHLEIKFVEKLNIEQAMDQARRDAEAAGNGDTPVVVHKRSRKRPLVTMDLESFLAVIGKEGQ